MRLLNCDAGIYDKSEKNSNKNITNWIKFMVNILTAWCCLIVSLNLVVSKLDEGIILFCQFLWQNIVVFFSNFWFFFAQHTFTNHANLHNSSTYYFNKNQGLFPSTYLFEGEQRFISPRWVGTLFWCITIWWIFHMAVILLHLSGSLYSLDFSLDTFHHVF